MNYHSDEWIMYGVKEHYNEALEYFPKDKIIGIFYQGSGNYGLDYEDSDVDTKLVIAPSIKNLAMLYQTKYIPVSCPVFRFSFFLKTIRRINPKKFHTDS